MADIVDIAAQETAAFTYQALADCRQKQQRAPRSHRKCANCGGLIPDERRQAVPGVKLCVECQKEIERGRH